MLINFIYFLMCVFSVFGLFCEKPCEVCPEIPDRTVNVPEECKSGTFRWDYHEGHVMLHFKNMHGMEIIICIKVLGGAFFNVTDKATNERLGPFDYASLSETYACLQPTSEREVVLQVDAPLDLRYMGEFEYRIYK